MRGVGSLCRENCKLPDTLVSSCAVSAIELGTITKVELRLKVDVELTFALLRPFSAVQRMLVSKGLVMD